MFGPIRWAIGLDRFLLLVCIVTS